MNRYRVTFEIRKQGAIGEFTWGVGADVEAETMREALDDARMTLNDQGYETRGHRVESLS